MFEVVDKKDVTGKVVLLRVNFDVSLTRNEDLWSDYRIKAALPTIKYLIKQNTKLILATHLGRPEGFNQSLSTVNLLPVLKRLLGVKISVAPNFDFSKLKELTRGLQAGEILLLENLRFYPGEIENDTDFVRSLAELAEVFVNDDFGTAHRVHASMVGVPKFLPSYAGFLLAKEVQVLGEVFESKARPLTFIVGGGKATTKAKFLRKVIQEADFLLIGGVLANVFLKAQGFIIGRSKADEESIKFVSGLKFKPNQLILPEDFMTADAVDENAQIRITDRLGIKAREYFLDIGPKSLEKFASIIKQSKIVVWNGPLGYYEIDKFAQGTLKLGEILASSKARKIIGGGDLTVALSQLVRQKKFDHVSTGGGAMLEFLAGEKLPGLEALGYYR